MTKRKKWVDCRDGSKVRDRVGIFCYSAAIACLLLAGFMSTLFGLLSIVLSIVPLVYLRYDDAPWMIKFYHWLDPNSTVVEVWEMDKKKFITLAYPMNNGQMKAYVYHSSQIGQIILDPDGVIPTTGTDASYCFMWLPVDPELRAEQLLTYDFSVLGRIDQMTFKDWNQHFILNARP